MIFNARLQQPQYTSVKGGCQTRLPLSLSRLGSRGLGEDLVIRMRRRAARARYCSDLTAPTDLPSVRATSHPGRSN